MVFKVVLIITSVLCLPFNGRGNNSSGFPACLVRCRKVRITTKFLLP